MANKFTEVGRYQVSPPYSRGGIDTSGFNVDNINPSSLLAGSSSLVREMMAFNRMKLEHQKANIQDGLKILEQITRYSQGLEKAVGQDPKAREYFNNQIKPYHDAIKGIDLNNPASLGKLSNYAAALAVDMSTPGSYFNTLYNNAKKLEEYERLQSDPQFMKLQEQMPYLLENEDKFRNFKGSYTFDEDGKVSSTLLEDIKISPYQTSDELDRAFLERIKSVASQTTEAGVSAVPGMKGKVMYSENTLLEFDEEAVEKMLEDALPMYQDEINRRIAFEKSRSKNPDFDENKRREELTNEYADRLRNYAKKRIVKSDKKLQESDYYKDIKVYQKNRDFIADQAYKAGQLQLSRERLNIAKKAAEKENEAQFRILPKSTGQQISFNKKAFSDSGRNLHSALNPYKDGKGTIRQENLNKIGNIVEDYIRSSVSNYTKDYEIFYQSSGRSTFKKPILAENQFIHTMAQAAKDQIKNNRTVNDNYFKALLKKHFPDANKQHIDYEAKKLSVYYHNYVVLDAAKALEEGGLIDRYNASKSIPEAHFSLPPKSEIRTKVALSLGIDAGLFANKAIYDPNTGKLTVYKEKVNKNQEKTGEIEPYEVKDPEAKRAIINEMLNDPGFKKFAEHDPANYAKIVNAAFLSNGLTPSTSSIRLNDNQWNKVLNSDSITLNDLGIKLPIGLNPSVHADIENVSVFTFKNNENEPVFIVASDFELARKSPAEKQQYLQSLPLLTSRELLDIKEDKENILYYTTPKNLLRR